MEIERSTDADLHGSNAIAVGVGKKVLLRIAQTNENDSRTAFIYFRHDRLVFFLSQRTIRRGNGSRDSQRRNARLEFRSQVPNDFAGAAVKENGYSNLCRPAAKGEHRIGTANAVRQTRAMQPVNCPTNRLPVGSDDFEPIDLLQQRGRSASSHNAIHWMERDHCRLVPPRGFENYADYAAVGRQADAQPE